MPRHVFGYGSKLTIKLAPLVAGDGDFSMSSISLESEGILHSPDSSPGLGPAWEGGPADESDLVFAFVWYAGDEAKQIIFTSPWGTPCGALPDGDFIQTVFMAAGIREPTFYEADTHGSGWSDELTEGEQGKVHSALHLLASLASFTFFNELADAFNPETHNLGIEGNKRCNAKYTIESLIRRVRYRFSSGVAQRSTLVNGSEIQLLNEHAGQLGLIDEPIIVGKTSSDNPFYKLFYGYDSPLSVRRSALTQGLDIPASFALPLNWPTAMRLCPPGADEDSMILAELPSEVHGTLSDLGNQLSSGEDSAKWAKAVSLLIYPSGPVGPIVGAILYWLARTSKEALGSAGDALQSAGSTSNANDVAAYVLTGLLTLHEEVRDRLPALYSLLAFVVERVAHLLEASTVTLFPTEGLEAFVDSLKEWKEKIEDNEDGTLFGLTPSEVLALVLRLHSNQVLDDEYGYVTTVEDEAGISSTLDWRKPILHLDPELFNFFSTYRIEYSPDGFVVSSPYESGYSTDSYTGSWNLPVEPEHEMWLRRASPTLQLAYTLELASVIVEQTFNQESILLALSGLASSDSFVGSLLRNGLTESGASGVVEVMGGLPVSRLIRYLWRQAMVDLFITRAAQHTDPEYDMDCVYEIFCWMREEEDRLLLDEVLGGVNEEGTRDFNDGYFAALIAGGSPSEWWEGLDSCQRARITDMIRLWDEACLNDWLEHVDSTIEGMRDPAMIDLEPTWRDLEDYIDELRPEWLPVEHLAVKDWRRWLRWEALKPERYGEEPMIARGGIAEMLLEPSVALQGYRLELTMTAGVAHTWTIRRGA